MKFEILNSSGVVHIEAENEIEALKNYYATTDEQHKSITYVGDDDEEECWEDDEIYDAEGNVVWSRYYEGQFVDLKCGGCGCTFQGLPDHGYCPDCADKRERGEDLEY